MNVDECLGCLTYLSSVSGLASGLAINTSGFRCLCPAGRCDPAVPLRPDLSGSMAGFPVPGHNEKAAWRRGGRAVPRAAAPAGRGTSSFLTVFQQAGG